MKFQHYFYNKNIKFTVYIDTVDSPFFIPLMAGMSARVISVTFVSPLELIRTKMQSQRLSYFGKQQHNVFIYFNIQI